MYKLLPILLFAYGLALTTDDIYDNSYALIIGIDKYENVRSLDYAVKDAEDIQSMLVDKFNFQQDNIVLLKNEEATQASILQEFSNITKKANDNDRVLIFFAGHGETIDLPDGGEMGFLLPVDGDKTDLYLSAIKMEELRTLSLLSDAKHILYLVDACYGGIVSVGARGLDAESTPNYLDKITKYKSRQIISAGGRGEEVIEKAEWGHSAFTKNLLSGLRDSKADTDSDGIITVQELGTYLQKKVTIDSDNRQTPKTRNLSSDEGEFVFVYADNTTVIQDKSADDKLDYLISEVEVLKSQKSSGDDIAAEKDIDGTKSWYEKYGHKEQGIVFMVLEETYQIGYTRNLNENWVYFFGYAHVGNNIIKKVIITEDSHSANANYYLMGLSRTYHFTDNVYFHIGGVASYMTISWKDIEQNKSGDFNKIVPATNLGIAVSPYQFEKPFPMSLVVSVDIHVLLVPTSYSETDGILTFADLQIKILPGFLFHFGLPLPK